MKDITLLNMNMYYIRYADRVEKELHVPLGPLYLAASLESAGYSVDFRDYQTAASDNPFSASAIAAFLENPAEIIGVSVMTNLLPFTIIALKHIKETYPGRTIVLGGVGPKAVEREILSRFPWIDVISVGESELSLPLLIQALQEKKDLSAVPGILYRKDGKIFETPRPARIMSIDSIAFPAFHHIDLNAYEGYNVISSRGCPYRCTFCSVAPIWDHCCTSRSAENIAAEIRHVHEQTGADLFLFQDEFFVSSKEKVFSFCDILRKSRLKVEWKAFGRVDLTDSDMMKKMASSGCIEIRYGIESGSPEVLRRTKKGFTPEDAIPVVSKALKLFPRVDTFFMWGFPFEEIKDFYQSLFLMANFRGMGARILPSLLCFLPQTELYREYRGQSGFSFSRELFPEYMLTGHEICEGPGLSLTEEHMPIFDFITRHSEIFPGFFHYRLEENILPKLQLLQEFGFYMRKHEASGDIDSCGAHSPKGGSAARERARHGPAGTATATRKK